MHKILSENFRNVEMCKKTDNGPTEKKIFRQKVLIRPEKAVFIVIS
jgi:hypothetical protein